MLGLTGGTASGKTSIATKLEDLGACCIDCDKVSLYDDFGHPLLLCVPQLGHNVYRVGTIGYSQVVEEFGEGVSFASNMLK